MRDLVADADHPVAKGKHTAVDEENTKIEEREEGAWERLHAVYACHQYQLYQHG